MAKVCNALPLKCIKPEIKKILKKNQNVFQRNRSITSQILTIHWIIKGVCAKYLEATLLFVDLDRGKMEQIFLAYGLPIETVTAITMLERNMKVKVCSPDGDTDFFEIVAEILQGDTVASYLFIIYLDYLLWTLIDLILKKWLYTKKDKKQMISHRNYNRCRLCRWHSASCKYPYTSLEQAAGGTDIHVNANKNEYMF